MINKLFINYCQNCESLLLSDNPNKKMIQQYTRTFSFSSSLPLYVNPPYSTHTCFLQSAQQFTECLERRDWMLHTPVTSLITSQATARPLWSIMLFEQCPLPSPLQLPSKYEEEKVHKVFTTENVWLIGKNTSLFFFYLRGFKIVWPFL